ncbi:hypothetical protein KUH03_29655 [Sphingobacterium sp. E70]|uniref:hypothetical protein n=1 Tax=Sphingobacterium sp. E70 TaxID=2853439 RepID=UPI00211C6599|nr:hypothetical protein [Sphingobacterium sp. E70]ULT23338.1 hypothetical protein KUH03_29655 [Sphingobacterium sp. E70]
MDIKAYISSGIIESYVLGLASEEEVSILNCIRKNNVEVEQAIAEAEKTLEELADIQAMAMPVSLKEDIWNKLNTENLVAANDLSKGKETEIDNSRKLNTKEDPSNIIVPRKSYNWAIAASVLLVLSVGANVLLYQQNNETKDKLTKTSASFDQQQASLATLQDKWRLVQNPAIKTIPLKGVENKPDLHALVFGINFRKQCT